METLISPAVNKKGNYSFSKVNKNDLYALCEFIVIENYKHHMKVNYTYQDLLGEINEVYFEELAYSPYSEYFVAKDKFGKMIGCIRTMKWNKKISLPIQKIFDINPLSIYSSNEKPITFWHVGRFAISKDILFNTLTLFKQLVWLAINPICQDTNSVMIAECDKKLMKSLNMLGIKTLQLGNGIHYIGSETIPISVEKQDLLDFYNNNTTTNRHRLPCKANV